MCTLQVEEKNLQEYLCPQLSNVHWGVLAAFWEYRGDFLFCQVRSSTQWFYKGLRTLCSIHSCKMLRMDTLASLFRFKRYFGEVGANYECRRWLPALWRHADAAECSGPHV